MDSNILHGGQTCNRQVCMTTLNGSISFQNFTYGLAMGAVAPIYSESSSLAITTQKAGARNWWGLPELLYKKS